MSTTARIYTNQTRTAFAVEIDDDNEVIVEAKKDYGSLWGAVHLALHYHADRALLFVDDELISMYDIARMEDICLVGDDSSAPLW